MGGTALEVIVGPRAEDPGLEQGSGGGEVDFYGSGSDVEAGGYCDVWADSAAAPGFCSAVAAGFCFAVVLGFCSVVEPGFCSVVAVGFCSADGPWWNAMSVEAGAEATPVVEEARAMSRLPMPRTVVAGHQAVVVVAAFDPAVAVLRKDGCEYHGHLAVWAIDCGAGALALCPPAQDSCCDDYHWSAVGLTLRLGSGCCHTWSLEIAAHHL